ncbi:MAG: hypothetical protein ACRD96_19805 [Bryobacteraceae bacterium]
MDLKAYYQKIRETEQAIADEYPVVVSFETPDGGKANVGTEVPRRVAARMIVEGRARLATEVEARDLRTEKAAEATRAAEQRAGAARGAVKVATEAGARVKGKQKAS